MTTETHRHEIGPLVIHGWGHADPANPIDGGGYVPTVIYNVTCEALEPHNDPSTEIVLVEFEEGATWATCPRCREQIRVG